MRKAGGRSSGEPRETLGSPCRVMEVRFLPAPNLIKRTEKQMKKKISKKEQLKKERRLKIRNIIYGELDFWIDDSLIPPWFNDCTNHIIARLDEFVSAQKEVSIFKGKVVRPEIRYVGNLYKPKTTKDRFGELRRGQVRSFLINTRWGQLHASSTFGGKNIEIIVRETKKEK